jgi:hypothetical protein
MNFLHKYFNLKDFEIMELFNLDRSLFYNALNYIKNNIETNRKEYLSLANKLTPEKIDKLITILKRKKHETETEENETETKENNIEHSDLCVAMDGIDHNYTTTKAS